VLAISRTLHVARTNIFYLCNLTAVTINLTITTYYIFDYISVNNQAIKPISRRVMSITFK